MISINPYSNIYKPSNIPPKTTPSFGSNYDKSYDAFTNSILTQNATCFFRGDLDWKKFCKFIDKHFAKEDKVSIICVACSDGSEPISLLLKLKETLNSSQKLAKFTPIKAYDIDKKQIEIAKSGKIPLINSTQSHITDLANLFWNARKSYKKDYTIENGKLILSDTLKDKINYENANICTVLSNTPKDKPTVLLIRNIFPYLNDFPEVPIVMNELSKFKEGTILAIGDYDTQKISNLEEILIDIGFEKTKIKNCYVKK